MLPDVLVAAANDAAEPGSELWVPLAGAALAAFTAVWSVVQRWNFALRVEATEGKLRFSVTIARRHTG